MDLLQNLLGGGQQRQQFQDFVNRYDQGAPYDGISDQEAIQQSAQDAFAQMSPQERLQFGQHLRQRSQQQGYNIPDLNGDGIDDRMQDPAYLAQVTSRMHQQQPGLFSQLLGGGQQQMVGGQGSNLLSNPLAKAAMAGIAAMAVKRMMSGGFGGQGGAQSGLGGLGGLLGGNQGGNRGGGFGGVDM
jgi:hypothetical protein